MFFFISGCKVIHAHQNKLCKREPNALSNISKLLKKFKSFLGSPTYKNVALILVFKTVAKIPKNYDDKVCLDVIVDASRSYISKTIEEQKPQTKEEVEYHNKFKESFAQYTKKLRLVTL